MHEAECLFEAMTGSGETSFNSSEATKRVKDRLAALAARSDDQFWLSSQCKSLILMRFIRLSVDQSKIEQVGELIQALYLDKIVSKLQLRRAILRVCLDFG